MHYLSIAVNGFGVCIMTQVDGVEDSEVIRASQLRYNDSGVITNATVRNTIAEFGLPGNKIVIVRAYLRPTTEATKAIIGLMVPARFHPVFLDPEMLRRRAAIGNYYDRPTYLTIVARAGIDAVKGAKQ